MRPLPTLTKLSAFALVVLTAACSSPTPAPEVTATAAAPTTAVPSTATNDLQAVFDGVMEEHHMPQGVAAVSVPGVDPWEGWFSATGYPGDPSDPLNRYPIRSVTKSFTVTLVLMLAKNHELSMKDPISDYVDGVPNGDNITLDQLAAMRSGLVDYTQNEDVLKILRTDPGHQWTTQELLNASYELKPNFP